MLRLVLWTLRGGYASSNIAIAHAYTLLGNPLSFACDIAERCLLWLTVKCSCYTSRYHYTKFLASLG